MEPDNSVNQEFLKQQLQKVFQSDRELMREIATLLKADERAGMSIIASGDRSVAGMGISGPVITGDVTGGITIKIEK